MIKEKFEEMKEKMGNKKEENSKKKIENLIVLLIIIIVMIIAINYIWNDDKAKEHNSSNFKTLAEETTNVNTTDNLVEVSNSQNELEKNLESILRRISGVRRSTCFNYIFRK